MIFRLRVQSLAARLVFPLTGFVAYFYAKYIRRVRIADLPETRKLYTELTRGGEPTLICANHLTMFDSLYLHRGLATFGTYLRNFRLFSWNIAAREHFKSTLIMRLVTYLGRCIPIDRDGDSEHHRRVLEQYAYLLKRGHICTIFPEGGRSRSGRVEPENVAYGVGRLLMELEHPRVLCVYLRGARQEIRSRHPARGDVMYLALEEIRPRTDAKGLRGARELSRAVIARLKEMEDSYFAKRGTFAAGQ